MKYKILQNISMEKLEKEVMENIQWGWIPQGGISVTYSGTGIAVYVQAMIMPA